MENEEVKVKKKRKKKKNKGARIAGKIGKGVLMTFVTILLIGMLCAGICVACFAVYIIALIIAWL